MTNTEWKLHLILKVEVKPWLADCPLPEHEDLFILEEK